MSPERNEQLTRHYEREAEATRHSLANSLRELDERLTPGHVFDEVLTYAKGGGGTFARAFSNAVRDNPMPSLLIGTGCMLFLSERTGLTRMLPKARSANQGDDYYAEHESPGIAEAAKEKVSKATESVKHGIGAVGDAVLDASQRARETTRDMREGVTETVEQVKQGAESVRQRVTEKAVNTGEQAMEAGRQVKDKAANLIHEQPLLIAGLGLAFGAAIAALLPSTKVEDELMGETSDSVKRKIGDAATQQFQTVKETASDLVDEAKNVAEREGLTPADMARKFAGNDSSQDSGSEHPSDTNAGGSGQPFPRV
jgi:ElaB/YqjD/DUF883 family membrane-anchored ribosome-binding protein